MKTAPLAFPDSILRQHVVVLGKTGAGKSSVLRHIVEHLLAASKRVCVIDPKGDWWGLKVSATGTSAGLPVIAFGDFKEPKATDVPINAHSGRHIAELISSGNRPCIIGMRGWMPGQLVKFWLGFAPALFNAHESGELFLVIDEIHNFAPKGKILDPDAGRCIHWTNRLMSEGRGLGLVCLIASQRPQKVHNDTLTCCETLVALRVVHQADRNAIKEWIAGCGDTSGTEVLNGLASLPRGSGWVWSPEVGYGPRILAFPMFSTFDSFAPPQLQKQISDKGWSTVDLDEVKLKLATVIEEHKANDPRELKKQIADLNHQLQTARCPAPPQPEKVTVPMLTEANMAVLERFTLAVAALKEMDLPAILSVLRKPIMAPDPRPAQTTAPKRPPSTTQAVNGILTKAERAILTVLAQSGGQATKRKISLVSGYSGKSSSFHNALSSLRTAHRISSVGDTCSITPTGLNDLGAFDPLPIGELAIRHWINRLSKCEATILDHLLAAPHHTLGRTDLSLSTGYSETSSSFHNSLSSLRTRELICGRDPSELILP